MAAAKPQGPCSLEGVEIKGGSFRLLKEGQALEYVCPSGFYPYPVQARTCRSTGSWSALQTKDQKIVKKAECRGWRAGRAGRAGPGQQQGEPCEAETRVGPGGLRVGLSGRRSCLGRRGKAAGGGGSQLALGTVPS